MLKASQPHLWKHARLDEIEAFLKAEVIAGRYVPMYDF